MNIENLIGAFQCPGCVSGSNTQCGRFKLKETTLGKDKFASCENHAPGTSSLIASGFSKFLLGMPKGFNKVGEGKLEVRIHQTFPETLWDKLNIPVWAMEQDTVLFVRTYSPRINRTSVDIIPNGTIAQLPVISTPINVGDFVDEID